MGRDVSFDVRRVAIDGTLWIPGGYAARISSGQNGVALPYPVTGVFDDGQNTPVVFMDNGCTPLVTSKIDSGRGFPALVLAGLTPGQLVAFAVAKTRETAQLLNSGGNIATDAAGRVVMLGAETDATAALGGFLRIGGVDRNGIARALKQDSNGVLHTTQRPFGTGATNTFHLESFPGVAATAAVSSLAGVANTKYVITAIEVEIVCGATASGIIACSLTIGGGQHHFYLQAGINGVDRVVIYNCAIAAVGGVGGTITLTVPAGPAGAFSRALLGGYIVVDTSI